MTAEPMLSTSASLQDRVGVLTCMRSYVHAYAGDGLTNQEVDRPSGAKMIRLYIYALIERAVGTVEIGDIETNRN